MSTRRQRRGLDPLGERPDVVLAVVTPRVCDAFGESPGMIFTREGVRLREPVSKRPVMRMMLAVVLR